jgi:hypothetical protein
VNPWGRREITWGTGPNLDVAGALGDARRDGDDERFEIELKTVVRLGRAWCLSVPFSLYTYTSTAYALAVATYKQKTSVNDASAWA